MKKDCCKYCFWRVDDVCFGTNNRIKTRYVRLKDCLAYIMGSHDGKTKIKEVACYMK